MERLKQLAASEVEIVAVGKYPTKQHPKVQDVANYQNDGTDRIKPSRFIERAEKKAGGWTKEIDRAVEAFLFDGDKTALLRLGVKVADDITAKIDRIDTRRLKGSLKVNVK